MYLVIRISTPFVFNSKREAVEYMQSEIENQTHIDESNIKLWRIDADGSCDPLDFEAVKHNILMGYHE